MNDDDYEAWQQEINFKKKKNGFFKQFSITKFLKKTFLSSHVLETSVIDVISEFLNGHIQILTYIYAKYLINPFALNN